MPRQARERDLFGTYHVSQQAREGRMIFRNAEQRESFLDILQNSLQQYPCELLGYCLIERTQYHLVLRFNGCDISQFMASLNIRYTAAVNESGMFRGRYRSELLSSEDSLDSLLTRLEQRGREAEMWNSYCKQDRLQGRTAQLGIPDDPAFPADQTQVLCIETAAALREWLQTELTKRGRSLGDLETDKELRNTWICEARRSSSLTQRQIGDAFGGLSESMISKILKQGVTNA